MATLEELVISLVAETSGLRAELDKAAKATTAATAKMDDAIQSFSDNSSKKVGFFQTAMATMTGFLGSEAVLDAFNKVKEAAAFLVGEFIQGAGAAIAQEKALTQLANSLALTGNFSEDAIQGLQDFTDAMEEQTGVADDVIASNLAILSSITKLDAEGLKVAQKSALDLASAMGIDLETATRLVAKGVEGNVEAFKRYGITVQEGATKSENLNNILKALAGTQGSAAGAMDTFDGALKKVNNSYDNYFEALGKTVIENQAFKTALQEVNAILSENVNDVNGNSQSYKELAGTALVAVVEGLALVTAGFDTIMRTANLLVDAIKIPFQTIATLMGAAAAAGQGDFQLAWNHIKAEAGLAADEIAEDFGGDTALGGLTTNLIRVGEAAEQGLGQLKSSAEATIEPTVAAGAAVEALTQKQIEQAAKGKELSAELIAGIEGENALKLELMFAQLTAEQELLNAALVQKEITAETHLAASVALTKKYDDKALKDKMDFQLKEAQLEKQRADVKIGLAQSTANLLTAIGGQQNKAAFLLSKGAAIAQAIVATNLASVQALAIPPAPNFALANIARASGMINVAAIAASAITGLQSGIDSVPGIGARDNFPAMLAPGERVVPSETNRDLTAFLAQARDGGGNNVTIELRMQDQMIEFIEARILERQRLGDSLLQGAV